MQRVATCEHEYNLWAAPFRIAGIQFINWLSVTNSARAIKVAPVRWHRYTAGVGVTDTDTATVGYLDKHTYRYRYGYWG